MVEARRAEALPEVTLRRASVWSRRPTAINAAIVWTLALTTITIPPASEGVASWLDGSWEVALSLAHAMHLPLGSRLLFPYAPYGYLDIRIPVLTRPWYEAVAAGLVIHVALVAAIAVLLLRRRAQVPVWAAATVAVALGLPSLPGIDTKASLLAVILAFFVVDKGSPRWQAAAAGLCGAVLALLFLIKLSGVPLVAGVLGITLVATFVVRRWRSAAALIGAFVVVSAALWSAAGLGAGDVPRYLHAAFEFGSGYGDAMSIGGLTPLVAAGGAVIMAVGCLGIWLLTHHRAAGGLWLLLVATALFPLFKDSLVRDVPVREAIYFGVVAILSALSLAVLAPSIRAWRMRANVPAVVVLSAALAFGVAWRSTDLSAVGALDTRLASYGTVIRSLTSRTARDAAQNQTRATARSFHRALIASLPQLFPGATVDVMAWDIGLIYADPALNWDPRPLLSSYSAYTPWLDQQDADFLRSDSAPDFIVYTYISIDDRDPAFDEPATFRALLENYRMVRVLAQSAVMLRRISDVPAPQSVVGTTCAAMGSPVDVPQRPGARVYAHVSVTPTIAGSVLDLLAKSAAVRITLTTPSFSSDRRLVPSTAADGLYVSSYLESTPDVQTAMSGSGGVPVLTMTIHSDTWAWASRYCVTFTSTP